MSVESHTNMGSLTRDEAARMQQRETERAPGSVTRDFFGAFDGPFFQELAERKRKDRDAKIIVTAKDGQTGVGKTNFCDFMAYVTDTTPKGFGEDKTTIDPFEFLDFYNHLPEGSAAVMEEGEQFDSRRSTSNKNVDAAEKWQMARVRQIVAFINLPSPQEIDSRFERLADYWINVERRGLARVYKKKIHPTKRKLYYKTLQTVEWPNMDRSDTFRHMDSLKDGRLDDDEAGNNWSVYLQTEMTGSNVARLSACGVGRSRVSQIADEGYL